MELTWRRLDRALRGEVVTDGMTVEAAVVFGDGTFGYAVQAYNSHHRVQTSAGFFPSEMQAKEDVEASAVPRLEAALLALQVDDPADDVRQNAAR